MSSVEIENKLNQSLDEILFQLSKGTTIEGLKNGRLWMGFEQVKEWKSRFGFKFHIHSNDHLLKNEQQEHKPHFHLKKPSENIDCRMFFDGTIYDSKGDMSAPPKLVLFKNRQKVFNFKTKNNVKKNKFGATHRASILKEHEYGGAI